MEKPVFKRKIYHEILEWKQNRKRGFARNLHLHERGFAL